MVEISEVEFVTCSLLRASLLVQFLKNDFPVSLKEVNEFLLFRSRSALTMEETKTRIVGTGDLLAIYSSMALSLPNREPPEVLSSMRRPPVSALGLP